LKKIFGDKYSVFLHNENKIKENLLCPVKIAIATYFEDIIFLVVYQSCTQRIYHVLTSQTFCPTFKRYFTTYFSTPFFCWTREYDFATVALLTGVEIIGHNMGIGNFKIQIVLVRIY